MDEILTIFLDFYKFKNINILNEPRHIIRWRSCRARLYKASHCLPIGKQSHLYKSGHIIRWRSCRARLYKASHIK